MGNDPPATSTEEIIQVDQAAPSTNTAKHIEGYVCKSKFTCEDFLLNRLQRICCPNAALQLLPLRSTETKAKLSTLSILPKTRCIQAISHCFIVLQSNMLVAGLVVSEYYLEPIDDHNQDRNRSQVIIYIEKVDTSGHTLNSARPGQPSVASCLVLGYLDYVFQTIINQTSHILVYTFAKAKPQYIFPNSAQSPSKQVLSDRKLISWWKRIIEQTVSSYQDKYQQLLKGYWYIPGSEQNTRNIEFTVMKYGVPFMDRDMARMAIPRFPDDPITRVLKGNAIDSKTNVQSFLDILSFSEECGAGQQSGMLYITYTVPEPCSLPTDKTESGFTMQRDASSKNDVFDQVWNLLINTGDFSTRERAEMSSNRVIHLANALGIDILNVPILDDASVSLNDDHHSMVKGGAKSNPASATVNVLLPRKTKHAQVDVNQNAISVVNILQPRRKRTTDVVEEPHITTAVNTLIPRKKPRDHQQSSTL